MLVLACSGHLLGTSQFITTCNSYSSVVQKRDKRHLSPFCCPSLESIRVDSELPFQLLLEHDDQDDAGYMSSMFLLLRANPDNWMTETNIALALSSLPVFDV